MRDNPAGDWRYAQLVRVLRQAGFRQVGSEGSHRTWIGPNNVRVTLKDDGARGVLAAYVRGTLAAVDAASERDEGQK
jgi:predicted RNA binding protein YcfA (HicA-like mRNA interferase family)